MSLQVKDENNVISAVNPSDRSIAPDHSSQLNFSSSEYQGGLGHASTYTILSVVLQPEETGLCNILVDFSDGIFGAVSKFLEKISSVSTIMLTRKWKGKYSVFNLHDYSLFYLLYLGYLVASHVPMFWKRKKKKLNLSINDIHCC
jgi:hypothetical protein